MEPTSNATSFTIESLATRWIMTPGKVRQLIASGQVALGGEPFSREAVLTFEATPHGKTIVLRAINIEADEVTRSHQQAAGYEPRGTEAPLATTIDGAVIVQAAR